MGLFENGSILESRKPLKRILMFLSNTLVLDGSISVSHVQCFASITHVLPAMTDRFSVKKWLWNRGNILPGLVYLLGTVVIVFAAVLDYTENPDNKALAFYIVLICCFLTIVLSVYHNYAKSKQVYNSKIAKTEAEKHLAEQNQALELVRQRGGVETLLETINEILCEIGSKPGDEPRLRLAVWVVDDPNNPQTVTQYTSIVGYKPDGDSIGKNHPVNCGIVGNAVRLRKPQHILIPEKTSALDYYIKKLGFTEQFAKELDLRVKSMYAVPVMHKDSNVIAVVYCSSEIAGFFGGNGKSNRKKVVQAAVPVFAATLFP